MSVAEQIHGAGVLFSETGVSFKNAEKDEGLSDRIKEGSAKFDRIASIEEAAYSELSRVIR